MVDPKCKGCGLALTPARPVVVALWLPESNEPLPHCGPCAVAELQRLGIERPRGSAPVCAWCSGPTVNDQLLHGSLRCPGRKERGER
jgi:hypothetical protein